MTLGPNGLMDDRKHRYYWVIPIVCMFMDGVKDRLFSDTGEVST